MSAHAELLATAQERLAAARSLLITAGAGMGVDSGLPDFRGDRGFWQAYPAYGQLGLSFVDLANPRWFTDDPTLAWGFYGHRQALYRRTAPHAGFARLHARAATMATSFVFTSNVDGQFQRAGFDDRRLCECHGTIHLLQCTRNCRGKVWPAPADDVEIDPQTFRASSPLPRCPDCDALARPNILMFGDGDWEPARTLAQEAALTIFIERSPRPMVVVECGAGTAVPTVRSLGEQLAARGATLIRINVRGPA